MEKSEKLLKEYDILRRQVEHEDNLVIQRLNWLLVANGFLFVAFAQILATEKITNKLVPLLGIGCISIMVTIFSLVGLFAAFNALRSLHEAIEETIETEMSKSGTAMGGVPKIVLKPLKGGKRVIFMGLSLRWIGAWYASGKNSALGIALSLLIAWVFLVAWSLITF